MPSLPVSAEKEGTSSGRGSPSSWRGGSERTHEVGLLAPGAACLPTLPSTIGAGKQSTAASSPSRRGLRQWLRAGDFESPGALRRAVFSGYSGASASALHRFPLAVRVTARATSRVQYAVVARSIARTRGRRQAPRNGEVGLGAHRRMVRPIHRLYPRACQQPGLSRTQVSDAMPTVWVKSERKVGFVKCASRAWPIDKN
jgi:hypothetical protein